MQFKKMLSFSLCLFLSCYVFLANAASTAAETQEKDGKIIAILTTIDNNEIAAANEALKRSTNPDVKNFAQTMITDHSKNLADFKTLSQKINTPAVSSDKSNSLQKQGASLLKNLEAVPANQFDTTYINAMVKGHEAALKAINDKLLPKASNLELKMLLKATSGVVAHHLELAKAVQTKLPASK